MAAARTARLAVYVGLAESQIDELATSPTTELVAQLLDKLEAKAELHKWDGAEKLRLEVELEAAVRTGEIRLTALRTNLEKAQQQAADNQSKLESEQQAKALLATELSQLKSSATDSSADLATLQQRIISLEASNRNTLSLLDSKSRTYDGLAQELSAKHQKTVELRREVSDLEDKIRAASNAANTAKFQEQALQQEAESLQRSNEYFEQELKTKTAEYAKSRKEKNARIADLQRQFEDASTTIEGLQRTEKALRARTAELETKTEDYMVQLQQAKEDLSRQEESFRAEISTANRLHELMKERADTEQERARFLQEQYDSVQDEARQEFAKMEEELNTAQKEKDDAEKRVAELEVLVERLENEVSTGAAAGPITPRMKGSILPGSQPRTPQRGMSPNTPTSNLKGSINYTQLVSDLHETRRQRDAEKRRNGELSSHLDQMIQDLEQRKPLFEQLTAEQERLQTDVNEMSALVESVGKERDQAKKDARSKESQVISLTKEGEILRQQARDLSSQIKILLLEMNARDQGRGAFTAEERLRLEQLAAADPETTNFHNDTDRYISENLVTYRNITELQEQNMKMLRISRELGDKMEGEEARARQSQAAQDHEELQELRHKYNRCRDEIKALITQSQSYIRERDIFRRMLSHRGQLPPQSENGSALGDSFNGDTLRTPTRSALHQTVEMSPGAREIADFNKLIKEMQTHFDNYKSEASEERKQLKEQVTSLTEKTSDLRNELARKTGELTLFSERYDMLHGNYTMLKNENTELQKRNQLTSDRSAQMDLRVQSAAEDLVEAKSMADTLRKESANLKAEKEFWKTVEKRLNEDNQALIVERDRLNTLIGNLQNLLNDREHSDSESRRRLQTQVENLENETQLMKRKIAETEQEAKNITLRREFENQESQTRLDDLVKSLGNVREELASVKATRDQLHIRVDELTIQLQSAEERVRVLSVQSSSDQDNGTTSLTQDQTVAIQASETKRDLELAKRELASAQEQVEQYKLISQQSEERLESLNETQDQYRQEVENMIEQKESQIKELQLTIEKMRTEASERGNELEILRTDQATHEHALQDQRSQLAGEITRLKDACERAETAARFHQEDLKAQAEIARQAQENYDNELQKHAEASKGFQVVRTEVNQLRLELVELRTAKEAAEQGLAQNEETWVETRARFEQEISELRSRRDDVNTQNKLLHDQLEKINSQVVELQRLRASGGAPNDADLSSSQSYDVAGLQELIKYLRREKEIVDIQYQQQALEAKRQRQQLEHLQVQLDDARLKLSQQRKTEEERERNALNHSKLVDTINELNLIRESNATLRLEKSQAQAASANHVKEIENLQNELQPLHAKVQELEDIRESLQEDLRMAREARERFEQRYHDIINKTEAIDPAEHESLKEKVTALEAERDELTARSGLLQEQVDGIAARIQESVDEANKIADERRQKVIEQAKNKNREQSSKIKETQAALQHMTESKDELQKNLEELRVNYEKLDVAKTELEARLEQLTAAPPSTENLTNGDADAAEVTSLRNQLAQAVAQSEQNNTASGQVREQLAAAQAQIKSLEEELSSARTANEQASAKAAELTLAENNGNELSESTELLRQELLQAIQDVIALREETTAPSEEEESQMQGTVADKADEILKELISRHEKRVADAQIEARSKMDALRADFDEKLKNAQATTLAETQAEHATALKVLRDEHQQELQSLQVRHQSEVDELQRRVDATANQQQPTAGTSEAPITPENAPLEWTREFLKTNKNARDLLIRNVQKKVTEAQEQLSREHAKQLAERLAEADAKSQVTQSEALAQAKQAQEEAVKQARESAQAMEAKKQTVKLNMAQNQARVANVKVEYVKTAALNTPEKSVKEVWDAAKDLKPPPVQTQSPVPTTRQNSLQSSTYASSPTTTKPPVTPLAAAPLPGQAAQRNATQSQAQTASGQNGNASSQPNQQAALATSGAHSQPTPSVVSGATPTASSTGDAVVQPQAADASQARRSAQQVQPGVGRGAARGGHMGPAAAAARGGRGQLARGASVGRGRGRGATGIPQPSSVATSSQQPAGTLNPQSAPFAPQQQAAQPVAQAVQGQKRGLDESVHAGGGPEKRARGGGGAKS